MQNTYQDLITEIQSKNPEISPKLEGGKKFKFVTDFKPAGDQPEAIKKLIAGANKGALNQVLLGVTGSGKTFTMAKVIEQTNRPALILAPNKTLAAQLYGEMKSFFPENAVEYFVSYYDYYTPEAYVPRSDTYIEKEASINEQIDRMRHSATRSLLERDDVIIVASVSCIYGLGSVESYSKMTLGIKKNHEHNREQIIKTLVDLQYKRNDQNFHRGTFRVRGDNLEIFPSHLEDRAWRLSLFGNKIESIVEFDPLTGSKTNDLNLIKSALEKKEKKLISIKVATKGNALKLSKMAEKNAKEALTRRIFESETNTKLLDQIAEKFQLNILPRVVEVYDNSHIQGSHSVGALISFGAEGFIKKRYRKFNIKNTNLNSGDDYGMLKEVLERRFSKIIQNKNLPDVIIPDLILIDGGKGQYSVSRKVLDDYGFHDIPIIAIAKGKNRNQGDETFIHKTNNIKLNKREPLLFFLQRLRDEAHRFAVSSHRIKRKKSLSKSLLDEISSIGRTRKRALLNYFGSARAVESASFDDLKRVEGIETSVAKKIHDFFH